MTAPTAREAASAHRFVIYRCPDHPHMVTLLMENVRGGTRLLGGKCCVNQYTRPLAAWSVTESMAERFRTALHAAVREVSRG